MYIIILRLCDSHIIHIGVTRRCNINKATFCQKKPTKTTLLCAQKCENQRKTQCVFIFNKSANYSKTNYFLDPYPWGECSAPLWGHFDSSPDLLASPQPSPGPSKKRASVNFKNRLRKPSEIFKILQCAKNLCLFGVGSAQDVRSDWAFPPPPHSFARIVVKQLVNLMLQKCQKQETFDKRRRRTN